MKKIYWTIGIVFIVLGAVAFYFPQQSVQESNDEVVNDELFDLVFADYEGNKVTLRDFKGTPLVVNVWAKWCPFCRKELPDFVTIQKEFGEDVLFIAIDRNESLGVAKDYTDELGITHDLVFLLDQTDRFYSSIGGFSMPETIFVDSSGVIQFHKRGVMDLAEIRRRTQELLSL